MKEYNSYMDNISVEPVLHEKIMKRITQKDTPPHRNHVIFRYAGIAACAMVLLLCVWAIPGLLNNPGEISGGDINIISSGDPQSGGQLGTITDDPSDPNNAAFPLYALTLNKADSQIASHIHIPGHFWYALTDKQLKTVLPDFTFPVSATVNYRGDGSIFNVVSYELSDNGARAKFNELYTLTEIQFAPGEIVEDVIYDYEPKMSDVYGVPVVAGVFNYRENDGVALYIASFEIDGIAYSIKLHDGDTGESGLDRLTKIVNVVIRNGAPDLSILSDPVIPELRDEELTLEQARSDSNFGAYLPENIPSRFNFESAQRFINQEQNSLSAYWYAGYDYIQWSVSELTDYDREHIVSVDEYEKYDLSLYPIPRTESVPDELWEYVNNPVFRADELSIEVIKARACQVADSGDTSGWRIDFSILYDDVIVRVNFKGVSPEQVWEMLT